VNTSRCTPHRTKNHVEKRWRELDSNSQPIKKFHSTRVGETFYGLINRGWGYFVNFYENALPEYPVGALYLLVVLQDRRMPRKIGVQRVGLGYIVRKIVYMAGEALPTREEALVALVIPLGVSAA
jgi:hypothetical protein